MPEFPQYEIAMDIQPYEPCEYCDNKNWAFSIVNTASRIDLFTGVKCKLWRGSSICKHCGMTTYWKIDPDMPYEPTNFKPKELE
jgi:hypothetical protein